jgi:hypothetical protein
MAYRGQIGALEFELERAGTVCVPDLPTRPRPSVEHAGLLAAVEAERTFLVLDHRAEPRAGTPAYVEYWRALRSVEGALSGMFVLSSGAQDGVFPAAPATLAALAAALPSVR